MSVTVTDDAIVLGGRCGVEDAESLLVAVQDHPGRVVDVAAVQRLHLAVAQVLLALAPPLRGTPLDGFLARHIFNQPDLPNDTPADLA